MKLKGLFKNTVHAIYESIKRFPITIGISTALVIMLIITNEKQGILSIDIIDILRRVDAILALGIPLSLCFKLIFEKRDTKIVTQTLVYALGAGFLVFYYFFLLKDFKMVSMTRYIGVSVFLYLAFLYIPWIGNKEHYEFYVIKVLSSFFLTVIYSGVLYFGLSAILFTIDKLFNAHIPGKLFFYMFLLVAGIFAPSFFLAKIPRNNHKFSVSDYPKPLKVLLLYIVIPLVTVYTAILYAYFVKIIITRNWPIGLVSHLVLWYSVITVGVIFFIFPILSENKLVKYFTFWFPKIIIPIIITMFFSIGIRIKAYGITENRYYVLILGLWVLGIMIYFSLCKTQKNIIIPISLSIIALNSVFGPLSSYTVSQYSQNKRFEGILARNNMLEDGKVTAAGSNISEEDKTEIIRIMDYFSKYHSLKNIKSLPSDFEVKDTEKVLGFPYTVENNFEGNDYFYYSSQGKEQVVKVSGYDYLIRMNAYLNKQDIDESTQVKFDIDTATIEVVQNGAIIYEREIDSFIANIDNKYKGSLPKDNSNINPKDLTFEDENENVKVKFIINYISGVRVGPSSKINTKDVEFSLLVKIK